MHEFSLADRAVEAVVENYGSGRHLGFEYLHAVRLQEFVDGILGILEIRKLARGLLHDPLAIDVAPRNAPTERVEHLVYHVEPTEKQPLLTLAQRIRTTMPPTAPNSLSVAQVTDLVSLLLKANEIRAGNVALRLPITDRPAPSNASIPRIQPLPPGSSM